jgi:hypothetical protein
MKPFLDAGFLGVLLLKAPGRQIAWELVQRFSPPHFLTHLQVLLIEHMLLHAQGVRERQAALRAHADWKRYVAEGVFQVELIDSLAVHTLAVDLNRRSLQHEAKPLHYLLAASAVVTQSTHLLSFDPRSRVLGKQAGLRVLPEEL